MHRSIASKDAMLSSRPSVGMGCADEMKAPVRGTANAFKVDRGKNIGGLQRGRRRLQWMRAQHRVHAALSVAKTRRV